MIYSAIFLLHIILLPFVYHPFLFLSTCLHSPYNVFTSMIFSKQVEAAICSASLALLLLQLQNSLFIISCFAFALNSDANFSGKREKQQQEHFSLQHWKVEQKMSFLLIFELAFVSVSIHRLPLKMRGRISVAHFFLEPGVHVCLLIFQHPNSSPTHWVWLCIGGGEREFFSEKWKRAKNRTEEWKLDVYNKFFFITPIEITKYCLSEIHSVNRERASEWYSVYHKNWNIENMRDMKTVWWYMW